jgi:hypothetical protein
MNMQEFADALASKDLERYSSWFSDDMRLYVPVQKNRLLGSKRLACRLFPLRFFWKTNTRAHLSRGSQRYSTRRS